jgi:hypothetical protein
MDGGPAPLDNQSRPSGPGIAPGASAQVRPAAAPGCPAAGTWARPHGWAGHRARRPPCPQAHHPQRSASSWNGWEGGGAISRSQLPSTAQHGVTHIERDQAASIDPVHEALTSKPEVEPGVPARHRKNRIICPGCRDAHQARRSAGPATPPAPDREGFAGWRQARGRRAVDQVGAGQASSDWIRREMLVA